MALLPADAAFNPCAFCNAATPRDTANDGNKYPVDSIAAPAANAGLSSTVPNALPIILRFSSNDLSQLVWFLSMKAA